MLFSFTITGFNVVVDHRETAGASGTAGTSGSGRACNVQPLMKAGLTWRTPETGIPVGFPVEGQSLHVVGQRARALLGPGLLPLAHYSP